MKRLLQAIAAGLIIGLLFSGICYVWNRAEFTAAVSPLPNIAQASAIMPANGSFRLKAVGDIMLARKVGSVMAERGVDYPVQEIAAYLTDADITLGNLESPLSTQGTKLKNKGIWFRGDPANAEALRLAGFDVLTLANNHALDYDTPALLETLDVLGKLDIATIGAGVDLPAARSAQMMTTGGVTTAYLGYSEMADIYWDTKTKRTIGATANRAGVAPLKQDMIVNDIKKARAAGAQAVIVTLHWGVEYQEMPESYQQKLAHTLVDAGADVIIGHHPHCIQGVELYKNGLICYSLGNFIFDQDWSEQTAQGLILETTITDMGWQSATLTPIMIKDCQPQIATGGEQKTIIDLVSRISQDFGTNLELRDGKLQILGGQ